jgi:superfamily II DNA or RNA helicase
MFDLAPHQERVRQWMSAHTTNTRLLVVHSVGSGKSVTAVSCILDNLRTQSVARGVIVTMNASLVETYRKQLAGCPDRKRVHLVTYGQLASRSGGRYSLDRLFGAGTGSHAAGETFLVLDEAHNMTPTSDLYRSLWLLLHRSGERAVVKKCLVMTATPIRDNAAPELTALMNLVVPRDRQGEVDAWTGYVSLYQQPCAPHVKTRVTYRRVYLTAEETSVYAATAGATTSLAAMHRQAEICMCTAAKLDAVVDRLQSDGGRAFVSCVYVNKCYEIADALQRRCHPQRRRVFIATGNEPNVHRIVDEFNATPGSVLVGTRTVSEGVSLRGVTQVHVLSPFWNDARLTQVVGRAVRYNSHQEPCTVDVTVYVGCAPPLYTIDQRMADAAIRKRAVADKYVAILQSACIEACSPRSPAADTGSPQRPTVCVPPLAPHPTLAVTWLDPRRRGSGSGNSSGSGEADPALRHLHLITDTLAVMDRELKMYIREPTTGPGGWTRIVGKKQFDMHVLPVLTQSFPTGVFRVGEHLVDFLLHKPTAYKSRGRRIATLTRQYMTDLLVHRLKVSHLPHSLPMLPHASIAAHVRANVPDVVPDVVTTTRTCD